MKSLELLRAEAAQKRMYRTRSNVFEKIGSLTELFQQRYPQTDWSYARERSHDDPSTGNYDLAVRHMIKWGKADARIIEDVFHIRLPQSIHEMYAQIQEACLIWRNIIHILHPKDVVAWELQNREWEGKTNQPVRLVRFIQSERTSGDIALRKSVSDNKWRIHFCSIEEGPNYESPSHDGCDLAEDLDDWLMYMMAHDGAFSPDENDHAQAACLIERIG